jgi:Na+-transporting methylmalonyl-CoA/oxaloacetate decarboxylase gamma subunit
VDRELAQKNLRAGLLYAGIAIGVFGLAFVIAILYIGN